MKRICAWCQKEMGDASANHHGITHGICQECARILFNVGPSGESIASFLNALAVPVLAIDQMCRVAVINDCFRETFDFPSGKAVGAAPGDIFQCDYALTPEGCGNTIHCSGCTIRRSILDSFETGAINYRVPAVLRHGDTDVGLFITTERVGEVVFLRVDEVGRGNTEATA